MNLPSWIGATTLGETNTRPTTMMMRCRNESRSCSACLLNPNRNPDLNRKQIEQYLRDYLGVTNILWLGDGIAGDDTDGHVDDLARFVTPNTVVTVIEQDPQDDNHWPLQENLRRLRAM